MAAKDTQQDDHLWGLQSRCERLAMSGQVARNAPAPLRVQVFAVCVHVTCIHGCFDYDYDNFQTEATRRTTRTSHSTGDIAGYA